MHSKKHNDTAGCAEFTFRVHSDGRRERLASVYSDESGENTAACVEFAFRVHSDGRRECLATVLIRDRDGIDRPGPRRPTGELAAFVASAIDEAKEELSPSLRLSRTTAGSARQQSSS